MTFKERVAQNVAKDKAKRQVQMKSEKSQTAEEAKENFTMNESKKETWKEVLAADPNNAILAELARRKEVAGVSPEDCRPEIYNVVRQNLERTTGLTAEEKKTCKLLHITEEAYLIEKRKEN